MIGEEEGPGVAPEAGGELGSGGEIGGRAGGEQEVGEVVAAVELRAFVFDAESVAGGAGQERFVIGVQTLGESVVVPGSEFAAGRLDALPTGVDGKLGDVAGGVLLRGGRVGRAYVGERGCAESDIHVFDAAAIAAEVSAEEAVDVNLTAAVIAVAGLGEGFAES